MSKTNTDENTEPASAESTGSEDEDGACEHCGSYYDLREGQEPTPLCDECAQAEVERLRAVLKIIRDYYLGAGYIGAMADDALRPPNSALSQGGPATHNTKHDRERKRAERCKEVAGQLIGGNANDAELLIKMPDRDFILGRRMGQVVFVRFSEPDVS